MPVLNLAASALNRHGRVVRRSEQSYRRQPCNPFHRIGTPAEQGDITARVPMAICISSDHPRRQTLNRGAPPREGQADYQAPPAAEIRPPPFVSAADEHRPVIPSTFSLPRATRAPRGPNHR
jgi:hypothetical protein